jgi:hypothetical protein
MKKQVKNTTKTSQSISTHTKVSKGIYKQVSGKYAVRPTVNGKRLHVTFTSIKAAKAYLKGING